MVDVIVIGGGPAGLSIAILLAKLGRSVVVLERSRYERARAGETLGGELQSLFQSIGLWDDFQAIPKTPFRGVRSNWGGDTLSERSSIFNPYGEGWHIDRVAFDSMFARNATRAGVTVHVGRGSSVIKRINNYWLIRPALGEPVIGRFLVDASGRGGRALAASIPERRWHQLDRMVAVITRLKMPGTLIAPMLELEAVKDGWWYTAPQPDGRLLVTLMTDSDLLPVGQNNSLATIFSTALANTVYTARRCHGSELDGPTLIVRADTGVLLPDHGAYWRAIGDAAMGCDPLAGDGVSRALRSALDAAPLIEQTLTSETCRTPDPNLTEDTDKLRRQFLDYLDQRSRYYLLETRFPDAPFWARRRPMDWRNAPLFLHPLQLLKWDGILPARDLMAPVESLIPPRALRAFLRRLRHTTTAHEALAAIKTDAPLEDRRILVGVQDLIARGTVTIC